MNPLSNAKDCLLYDLKFRMITTARFSQSSPNSLTLILFSRPDRYFPERFRLVPAEYAKQGFPSYVCTLPSAFSAYRSEADGETYYIAEIPLQEARNQREDLRVNVDLEVPAFFNESEIPDMITIKNISAGGLMFLSPKQFGKYTPFLFHLETKKGDIVLTAIILSIRPAEQGGAFAYGCKFSILPQATESALRNFIFQQDLKGKR